MRPGLTIKLSVLLACIGVLASGATGYYAYRANRTMLVREAERTLLTSTELMAQRSSSAIDDVAADAHVMASLPSAAAVVQAASDTATVDARERLAQVFSAFMVNHPEYSQVRLIARDHYGLEVIRFDRDGSNPMRVQEDGLQEKGQFPYVFDTLARAPGDITISAITVNHEHGAHSAEGKPTLRLGTPVADAGGAVIGAVIIDVDLASMLKRLQADLPREFQVYLANEWGDFLVHPDATQTFGFDKGRRILMQESFPATRALFDQSASTVALNGLTLPQQAGPHVLAFIRRPFGASDGNRFVVLGLSRPLADVLEGADLLGSRIVHMVLMSSLLAILLAILFARALVKPLQTLAHAADHFFADQTMAALPLKRSDEIGVLARCFDRMRREIKSHIEVLHHKQHELAHLAAHDGLTGLPNRTLFVERLEQAIHEATVRGEPIAVLFVDLDSFKQINDQFGHALGDAVLVAVAARLEQSLRSNATIARLGGDEFIVMIPGPDSANDAPDVASTLIRALREELCLEGRRITVGASIGISEFPTDGTSAEELLRNADTAMYAAKSDGDRSWMRCLDLL
jgi:diguanylate cyclase (GGDEF)-like protein